MQFLVTAYDGKDPEALKRRMAAREKHIELGDQMRSEGKLIFGVAILGKSKEMIGSVYIVEFPSRQELDRWLQVEPYVTGGVWKDIQVQPCKVGSSFMDLIGA